MSQTAGGEEAKGYAPMIHTLLRLILVSRACSIAISAVSSLFSSSSSNPVYHFVVCVQRSDSGIGRVLEWNARRSTAPDDFATVATLLRRCSFAGAFSCSLPAVSPALSNQSVRATNTAKCVAHRTSSSRVLCASCSVGRRSYLRYSDGC